jgi:hypothetical protein
MHLRIIGWPEQPSKRGLCSSDRMKSRFAGFICPRNLRALSGLAALDTYLILLERVALHPER